MFAGGPPDVGKMLGGDEDKDPEAEKEKEEERQEALRQQEEERKAKHAKMEAEREAIRQGIRDKVRENNHHDQISAFWKMIISYPYWLPKPSEVNFIFSIFNIVNIFFFI